MRQLADSLFLHQDTCNVYVIRSGREAVLVDFGDGSVLDQLAGIGVDRVTDVLITHHHRDQVQGLPQAVAAGARIWAPHQEQELFHSIDRHWFGRDLNNNYNNREDRFSLLEPVPLAGTLKDYSRVSFSGVNFTVVPTPGHTTGSVTLLAEIDGKRIAFSGDLLYGPGQVWSLAATQWSYNGGEGIAGSILSLLDLKERQPDLLLPSHGEPMGLEAIDPTIERLAKLRELRRQNPRLFLLRERPFEPVTDHLLFNRTSMSNAYVLLSDSGKALCFDFGYDFLFGVAAGQDRAARRPWLYNLPALKQQFGVTEIEVALPTHFHDDHVAGLNLLREVEGTQVWCPERFADVLERPKAYDLPCLWYDPIPVDRRLPLYEPFQWQEYTLTLYPLSGHTYYSVCILVEVDGQRVLVAGDQLADGDGLGLNYVYKNGFRPYDYVDTAKLYREIRPDLIVSGHWGPIKVTEEYLAALDERGAELERHHRDLLPLQAADLAPDGFGTRIIPYQSEVAGGALALTVEVRNPLPEEAEVEVRLVVPSGWRAFGQGAESTVTTTHLAPYATGTVGFTVTIPAGAQGYRQRVAADLTVNGRRFGQIAEALVTITR